MIKYYDRIRDRLVFEDRPATQEFWDRQWQTQKFKEAVLAGGSERFVSPITKMFLPASKSIKILDGGCGRGQYVYSLDKAGYDAYGVDYARKTVKLVNKYFPALQIVVGDVRKTPYPDKYFDGYWSLGVIEHFYEGYDSVLAEMKRIIKPKGYLFLVFPYLSPIRRLKIRLNRYQPFDSKKFSSRRFYQFAFNDREVSKIVSSNGFRLRYQLPYEGFKGLKDEVGILRSRLQRIYDNPTVVNRIITYAVSKLLVPFSSHTILLVFEKSRRKGA